MLQTVVQLVILAQCGGYVPCRSAVMFPFQSIFTRGGAADSLEANAFFIEMKEMNEICTHANERSLVALDEPCVSTSARDGVSLCLACMEKLIAARSFVICATHFAELDKLEQMYSSVTVKEMKAREQVGKDRFEYLYQLGDGSVCAPGYGIKVAAEFLPPHMIRNARRARQEIDQTRAPPSNQRVIGQKAQAALLQKILALKASSLDANGLARQIRALRNRCSAEQE
jgi:DNA mismatch repair ATPase MutS